MTDTADTAALREAVTNVIDGFQADFVTRLGSNGRIQVGQNHDDWDEPFVDFIEVYISDWSGESEHDNHLAEYIRAAHPRVIKSLLDQLEAERQRADEAEGKLRSEVMKNLLTTDCMRKAHRKIAEMEGEQEPIAYLTRHMGCRAPDDCEEYLEVSDKDGVSGNGEPAIPVFTAPQKPVVLPGISELIDACDCAPAVRDVHVWDLAISEVRRLNPSLFSEKSSAAGIVKDGE